VSPGSAGSGGSTVADTLALMRGVWRDHVAGYSPDGTPLADDPHGGTPGPLPYEQLVYLDFDGERYTQTNVVLSGRPAHSRTFTGRIDGGVLVFDALGPEAPRMLGVSGGPGVLVFTPERVDTEAHQRFADPDWIRHLGGDQRTRTTTLYRDGLIRRVLTVSGTRIAGDTGRRHALDPRGAEGAVHEVRSTTRVYLPSDHDSLSLEESA